MTSKSSYEKKKKRAEKFNKRMLYYMQRTGFDRTRCVKLFRKWCKREEISIADLTPYLVYDRMLKKINCEPVFIDNLQNFLSNMGRVGNMVAIHALQSGDIQDFLAFADTQIRILGIESGKENIVSQTIMNISNNTTNNVTKEESTNELLERLKSGIERFGPVTQRFGEIGMDSGKPALGVVHTTLEATGDSI